MPGGQFTNLKEQARSLGLENRWNEVAEAYRTANDLFGDIIKVTPSSKVVGDMALMMTAQALTPQDVLDPSRDIAFPASVIEMLRGDLGQPHGGWPAGLQERVLKGETPSTARPGALIPPADLAHARLEAADRCGRAITESELLSYLMYPKVFTEFCAANGKYGPVSSLPTTTFFYGMRVGDEISVAIDKGKTLIIRLQALGETDEEGQVRVFFELNGQPRVIRVPNRSVVASRPARPKADATNEKHVAAPMPGAISAVAVKPGQEIKAGDILVTIEAMKMETTIPAIKAGVISELLVKVGDHIEAKDLLLTII